jgi:type IV pilus assembly protein PilA
VRDAPDDPLDTCISVDHAKFPDMAVADLLPIFVNPSFTFAAGTGKDPGIPGITPTNPPCPGCNISGFAAGNIDNEPLGIDTWFISTKDGAAGGIPCGLEANKVQVLAGAPFHAHNDVDCDAP